MMIPYLVKVSLVLAVLTLAYRWLIQFETFSKLNRVLLWVNVLAAWALPLVNLPSWGPVEMQTDIHDTFPKVVGQFPLLAEPLATIRPESFKTEINTAVPFMSAGDWLLVLYFAGVVVLAARLLFQIGRLVRVVATGRAERIADGTAIVRVAGASPYSFFKWIVLDPAKHSDGELRNIIAHEAGHARQWHSADLLLAELQKICLWFNPFSWAHQRLVQENLEYLADRAVLDNGFEKKQYQYNLLNTLMQSRELPLTNSFAQSLLKKRIQMMNRKPSHFMVWVKYAAVVALIYVSSAFVAPYREVIVELAPEVIRPLVKPLIAEVNADIPSKQTDFNPPENIQPKAKPQPEQTAIAADSLDEAPQAGTKGVLIVNQTLYWAITPLTTWEDITVIRNAAQKYGYALAINNIQYDPLQQYITDVSVRITAKNGGGSGEAHGEAEFQPIKGYSGYISARGHSMGAAPPEALSKIMEQDYQKAQAMARQNAVAYFEYKLGKSLGTHTASTYTQKILAGPNARQFYDKDGIGRSQLSTLHIASYHKEASFYLNAGKSTFTEVNEVPFSKVDRVTMLEDSARRKYFVVYTK
ncbi:MAG: M56 family metallopeptidase [Dyadobacter fermentans]